MRFKVGKLVVLGTVLAGTGSLAVSPDQSRQALRTSFREQAEPTMLQLRAGNYQAGFLPGKAFLPIRGHALTVEFVGTPGVLPTTLADPGTPVSAARRVFYEDLWPGVSVSFTLIQTGVCEAMYTLAPSADVAQIRLRYNAPARILSDGTLRFRFSTGQVSESSPEAWQMVGDRRKTVAVSFSIINGEVGFNVGNYDRSIPLIIDPAYRIAETRVSQFPRLRGEMPLGRDTRQLFRSNPPLNNHDRLRPTHEQLEKGFPEEYANRE